MDGLWLLSFEPFCTIEKYLSNLKPETEPMKKPQGETLRTAINLLMRTHRNAPQKTSHHLSKNHHPSKTSHRLQKTITPSLKNPSSITPAQKKHGAIEPHDGVIPPSPQKR